MSEKFWHLKNCDVFGQLTPEQLRRLEARCRFREFRRGDPIYLPADHAGDVFLLTSGRAKICGYTADGKQSILSFVEPGELFGELSIFDSGAREEYAEAIDAAKVVMIPTDEMQRLLEQNPQVALGVTKLIGLRRKRVERRLKYLLFHSNLERLIHLLLEFAEQYGRPTEAGLELGVKLSHQDIASLIGSTRETVTVLLGDLQNKQLVQLGRRKVVIADIDGLAREADTAPPRLAASD